MSDDLPDVNYCDMYEEGATPRQAWRVALEYADFPFDDNDEGEGYLHIF